MLFWSPVLHDIATLIHIFATVFWLGWMVFLFLILRPIASRLTSVPADDLMKFVRRRIRRIVFWLIPVILLTGLYNMGYRGLLNWKVLMSTAAGHRMLWKLGAAAVLFGVYYTAPLVNSMGKAARKENDFQALTHTIMNRIMMLMHVLAFTAGAVAAYIGITFGG